MYDLTEEEIEQERTPFELNEWVEETLNKFDTEKGVTAVRLKPTNELKVFMEESSALNILCQHLFRNRKDIIFKQVVGSQSYDVEVKGCTHFDYVEITYVTDREEHFRMMILDDEGSVSAIAPVEKCDGVTKVKNAGQLKCESIAMEHGSIITKSKDTIVEAFIKKAKKSDRYPSRTHLLIAFDDLHYLDKDKSFIEDVFNTYIVPEKADFLSVSLVGLSNKVFLSSVK